MSSAAGRVRVTVGSGGEKLTANPSVEQRVAVLGHPRDKWEAFLQLVEPFRSKRFGTPRCLAGLRCAQSVRPIQLVSEPLQPVPHLLVL